MLYAWVSHRLSMAVVDLCDMALVVVGFLWASRPIGNEFLVHFCGS